MEFLIAHIPDSDARAKVVCEYEWCRLSALDGPYAVKEVGNFLIVLPVREHLGDIEYYFDGHAFIGDALLTNQNTRDRGSEVIGGLAQYLSENSLLHQRNAAGVFCALSVDWNGGHCLVTTDPLSQYNLFQSKNIGVLALSNNVYMLSALYELMGAPLERSIESASYEAALGLGSHERTGFQEISLVPRSTFVKYDFNKESIEYNTTPEAKNGGYSHNEQLDIAACSLTNNVSLIHKHIPKYDIVYDLTGGIDSRLVLAASNNAGIRNQYFFRSPDGVSADVSIPNAIATKLALQYAPFPQNFGGEQLDYLDLIKRAVFRQQGQSTIYNFELGRYAIDQVARIRGGVGEITRLAYPLNIPRSLVGRYKTLFKGVVSREQRALDNLRNLALNHWSLGEQDVNGLAYILHRRISRRSEYFTNEFHRDSYKNIKQFIEELRAAGVPNALLANAYYLTDRSRRHFGYTSQMLNIVRPSFEPLADSQLWELAKHYTFLELKNGDMVHDLFCRLDQSLLSIPIDSSSLKNHKGFTLYDPSYNPIADFTTAGIKHIDDAILPEGDVTSENFSGHAAIVAPHHKFFLELLFDQGPDSPVWSYLERTAFEKLHSRENWQKALSRNGLMFLRLFYGLIWINGLEQETPIDKIA